MRSAAGSECGCRVRSETGLEAYAFDLPEELIALRPVEPQDAARLLVVKADGSLIDASIRDLPAFLGAGDRLVFNDTKVLPAALKGLRPARDLHGRDISADVNLVEQLGDDVWLALARPGKRLKCDDVIIFGETLSAEIVGKRQDGEVELKFNLAGSELISALEQTGSMPLPPYIARRRPADAKDTDTYQTGFAAGTGESVAAPTAGLHFTPRLMGELAAAGLAHSFVRLTVGLGTFAPLKQSQIDLGRLHSEWCRVDGDVAASVNRTRSAGARCVAVGTTALRTLESAASDDRQLKDFSGHTDIFIRPGYEFKVTDALVTNFHLPGSSLFMLICAMMGTETMQAAYAHAIACKYRFYSYGDACLLLP